MKVLWKVQTLSVLEVANDKYKLYIELSEKTKVKRIT